MKMAVSDQQHQSSVGTLQAALRHQENRCRSLQEELSVVQETLKKRDEEFESYKVCRQRGVWDNATRHVGHDTRPADQDNSGRWCYYCPFCAGVPHVCVCSRLSTYDIMHNIMIVMDKQH